jgi:hypothetical protein
MKVLLLIALLTTTVGPAFAQNEYVPVGAIDFYGYDGFNNNQLRTAIPLRVGDEVFRASKEKVIGKLRTSIKQATGREPSDVAVLCCDDQGRLTIYIGLSIDSVRQGLYNPAPIGSARLPPTALQIYREADQAWLNAMQRGVSGENDSQGYALSVDPEARTKQLVLHDYVARHLSVVRRVLASARDVEQRQIAAEMLGYANRSREQINALIHASRDVDDGVRNNATRALAVLARSSAEASAMIPGECFIVLLNSGLWTDRNKSAALLAALTLQRDPRLLTCLREQALSSLIEMARWSFSGHANNARIVLGRIAGIDEKTLIAMVERKEVEPIINALMTQKSNRDTTRLCRPRCSAFK